MKNWTTYKSGENPNVKNLTSKYIVKQLGCCLTEFFSLDPKKPSQRTKLIKKTLAQLGDKKLKGKPHYKVYANGLPPDLQTADGGLFKIVEWLYDLHWYEDVKDSHYQPENLRLVVECEWELKRKDDRKIDYSGVKYDFQKLLVTNAELRLMIFKITGGKEHKKNSTLVEYFHQAIDRYENLAIKSEFLFVAFDQKIKGFHYAEKLKGKNC